MKHDVHGHTLEYDDETHEGMRHLLHDLSKEEAEIFFKHAETHKEHGAEFEDDHERQFTLRHHPGVGYRLERREQ